MPAVPSIPARFGAILALVAAMLAAPALAQVDSREAIALQNQILQLRQEVEQLRRGGVSAPPASSGRGGGGDLPAQLLERVGRLEEEVRRMRGRLDELDFANRQQAQALEKLQGDIDFRLQQLEGGGGGARPPAGRPAPVAPPVQPPSAPSAPGLPPIAGPAPVAGAPAGSAPRTPERAIAEGRVALGRGDYAAAEAAAREALRTRGPRQTDAQLLLADSLSGKRDFAGAALAYNEAYGRARTGPRAPEALLGLAGSFNALGNKREACDTLADLRSGFPSLRGAVADRANAMRQRLGCR
jgi:TolA-binding protein